MPDRPAIGDTVHFTTEAGECRPMYVHHYLGTASLCLADIPPTADPDSKQPSRYWIAIPSDTREPHSWHTPCS